MPLALASGVVLVLFMSLPRFDANRYAHADIFSSAFPQERQRAAGGTMGHGGNQSGSTSHRRGQTGPMRGGGHEGGPMGHGRDQTVPMRHGRGRTSSSDQIPRDSFAGLSVRGFTVATGYVAVALLALTLLIGPANLLLRRRNPVSSYLRRDVGAWTAVFSLVHVIYGLQVHERLSDFVDYFVAADGQPLTNSFGLGNWTGLAALVIAAGLLALSSNAALRRLRAKNWKRLQRLNYALFALVVLHAFFYGALVRTDSPYTLLLLISVFAVFLAQGIGVTLHRRRNPRRTVRSA